MTLAPREGSQAMDINSTREDWMVRGGLAGQDVAHTVIIVLVHYTNCCS